MEQQQMKIDLDKTIELKCKCGNNTFQMGFLMRKVSRFVTQQMNDALVPVQIMTCLKCNTPLEETLPPSMRDTLNFEEIKEEEQKIIPITTK